MQKAHGKLKTVFNTLKSLPGRLFRRKERRQYRERFSGKSAGWKHTVNLREAMERRLVEKEAPTSKWGRILSKVKRFLRNTLHKFGTMTPWKKRALALTAIVLMLAGTYFWNILNVRSAAYSWIQSNWTGGQDQSNYPNHTSNQTGWTKYWSKDSNVKTSDANKVTLDAATANSIQTTRGGKAIASSSGAVRASNVVTITTTAAHDYKVGMTVAITGVTDTSFDGCFIIAAVPLTTTFTYAQTGSNATSANGIAGIGSFNRTIAAPATGAVRSSNVVTITTTAAHGFSAGMTVTVSGVTDASFNGTFILISAPSTTTFTYAQTAADATSGNGTASLIGMCNTIAAPATGAVRSSNVVTITTSSTHNFQTGLQAIIAGVTDATFNGTFTIASTPTGTTFTYSQTGSNATSGNGYAVMSDIPDVGGFDAWTKTNAYTKGTGTSASLALLKPVGATCSANSECENVIGRGCCGAGVCQNSDWYCVSALPNKVVYKEDESSTLQWKTALTDCRGPECATGLDTSYPANYSLIWSNASNLFASYPARLACYNRGARLPTMNELSLIYTNRANLGGVFQASRYWSATEGNTNDAWSVNFLNGVAYNASKTNFYYVRCVR